MPLSERERYITEVLAQAVEQKFSDEHRLQVGASVRQHIHQALGAGQTVEHPRFLWLKDQAKVVTDLLLIVAEEYDQKHPGDKASIPDLFDIINMVRGNLLAFMQNGVYDPMVMKKVERSPDPVDALEDGGVVESEDEGSPDEGEEESGEE